MYIPSNSKYICAYLHIIHLHLTCNGAVNAQDLTILAHASMGVGVHSSDEMAFIG